MTARKYESLLASPWFWLGELACLAVWTAVWFALDWMLS